MPCRIGTDVEFAAEVIRAGGLVGMPTETVYGLAANALDPRAVARIFEAKQRPFFDPLIVHVANPAWIPRVALQFPEQARRLGERFWPGPLTLVLPRTNAIPDLVTSGLQTVGVRVPRHSMAQKLLLASDCPIAAPSANLFGRISPTTASHVAEQLADRIDYILDGGPCEVGIESTVLSILPKPCLLRPGGVSLEDIESTIGPVRVQASTDCPVDESHEPPQAAPGMLPQHYAPRTPLMLLKDWRRTSATPTAGMRIGYLGFQGLPLEHVLTGYEILSPEGDLAVAAMNFFAALRRLDEQGLDVILAEEFPQIGLGRALNDRLRRACHVEPN